MLSLIEKIFTKENGYDNLTHLSEGSLLKHSKKENIKCYYFDEEKTLFIFLEKEEGLYNFSYIIDSSKVNVSFSAKKRFYENKELFFYPIEKNILKDETLYYVNSFFEIMKNTKEFRLKFLLNKKG